MTSRFLRLYKLVVGLGVVALATLAVSPIANAADTLSPSNITGTKGTLTIHKHAGDPGGSGDGTVVTDPTMIAALGQGLEGVRFSVQRVSVSGTPIDLTTAAGWDQAKSATPTNVTSAPFSLGTSTTVTTDAAGQAVVSNLPYGLYFVAETSPGANSIVSPVQPFLVSVPYPNQGAWLYNVHVYPKNKLNNTTPTKSVASPAAPVLGSKILWTVNAPIPPLATGDTYRSFSITDNLDSRLTYDDVVVKADGATLIKSTDFTVSGNTKITFTPTGLRKLAGKTAVTADITTTVTALGADGVILNAAIVNTNGSERTTNTPQTNWGPLQVVKRDATTKNSLQGAIFELYEAKNGTKVAGPVTTDANGQILINGLWVGNDEVKSRVYWLKETQPPAGYVLPVDPWTSVTVVANGTATPTSLSIANTQQIGPRLPLTGGAGSALFVAIGGLLVAAGVSAILVRRVRASRH